MKTEIPMKQWVYEQAAKHQVTVACFYVWLYKTHEIAYPPVRRVNKRVVLVKWPAGAIAKYRMPRSDVGGKTEPERKW